jgi:hypothetical protein
VLKRDKLSEDKEKIVDENDNNQKSISDKSKANYLTQRIEEK